MKEVAVIILAAGEGTRMKSSRAKVLHEIAGVPMICFVVETALAVARHVIVVVGYQADRVREALVSYPALQFAVQEEQLGTGHAVVCAIPEITAGIEDVAVLCGDTPLLRPQTLGALIEKHRQKKSRLSLITAIVENPFGYGRVVLNSGGQPVRIVEQADATEAEDRIRLVNTGAYCINLKFLARALKSVNNDNAQGEFYLTDVVELAYEAATPAFVLKVNDAMEVMGINTREELEKAHRFVMENQGR